MSDNVINLADRRLISAARLEAVKRYQEAVGRIAAKAIRGALDEALRIEGTGELTIGETIPLFVAAFASRLGTFPQD